MSGRTSLQTKTRTRNKFTRRKSYNIQEHPTLLKFLPSHGFAMQITKLVHLLGSVLHFLVSSVFRESEHFSLVGRSILSHLALFHSRWGCGGEVPLGCALYISYTHVMTYSSSKAIGALAVEVRCEWSWCDPGGLH